MTQQTRWLVGMAVGALVLLAPALATPTLCRGGQGEGEVREGQPAEDQAADELAAPEEVEEGLALEGELAVEEEPASQEESAGEEENGDQAELISVEEAAIEEEPAVAVEPVVEEKGVVGEAKAAEEEAVGRTPVVSRQPVATPQGAETPPTRPPLPFRRVAGPAKSDRVSNIWVDMEIRQVMQDISSQVGVAILCDQTVQGLVTLEVKDMPVEECLERVCAAGGYSYAKVKDYYVVGHADPGAPMFQRVAAPQRLKLTYATCDQVKSMLPAALTQYLTYDKAGGAVLVLAPELPRQRVLEVLKLIDQPNQQISIEAVVFELNEEGSKQLGLDWQYAHASLDVGGTNLVGMITFDAASEAATFVNVTLRAIIQERKGQVLANPRILVMNGQDADIFVGQEKYYSLLSGQASNPYYRLESIKAGVTLKVAPQIGDNGHIVLQLEPEVSDVVTERDRDNVNGDVDDNNNSPLPVVTRRRAKTVVSIKDGQTVIIGGLLREQYRSTVEKVPLLGDIPALGAAFRTVQKRKEQQEVVILITAYLVDQNRPAATESVARLEPRYLSPLDAIAGTIKGRAPCTAGKWE